MENRNLRNRARIKRAIIRAVKPYNNRAMTKELFPVMEDRIMRILYRAKQLGWIKTAPLA